MKVPIAFQFLVHILGRVSRIGKCKERSIYLLCLQHSFDHHGMWRIFSKMVPSLAGEGSRLTDQDPQIDAENILVMWLNTPHSCLDKAWRIPPWEGSSDDYMVSINEQRKLSGRWLQESSCPELSNDEDESRMLRGLGSAKKLDKAEKPAPEQPEAPKSARKSKVFSCIPKSVRQNRVLRNSSPFFVSF